MGNVKNALRGLIVSPEMLVVVTAAYLVIDTPNLFTRVSNAIATGPDAVKYLALLPAGVLAWSVTEAKSILLPREDTKALLQNWPRYPDLKARVGIGLGFQLLFALATFCAWVYSPTFENPKSFVVAGMSVVGSLVCSASFLMASIAARGITKRASA